MSTIQPKRARLSFLTLLVAVLTVGFAGVSSAVECRPIQSVQQSAVSAANNAAGGHLNQHIYGAVPPNGRTQTGKTLFTSVAEYSGFWNNYQDPNKYKGNAVACSGNTARQKVSVYSVLKKDTIGGYNCTASGQNGQCTQQTRSKFKNVQLDFEVVNGQWILLTAYPTN